MEKNIMNDKQAIRGLINLIKADKYISSILNDESYYSCINCIAKECEDNIEVCAVEKRVLDVANYCKLPYIGSGYARGVLELSNSYVAKVQLNDKDDSTDREYLLYQYVKRNKPQLAKFLLPPICKFDDMIVMPYCEVTNFDIPSYIQVSVEELFKNNGIILRDIVGRDENWGMYKGRLVLRDYGDWEFTTDQVNRLKRIKFKVESTIKPLK